MKILCLVDAYYPECNANTICMDTLMNNFKDNGYIVDFLSFKGLTGGLNIDESKNGHIFKIDSFYMKILSKYGKMLNAKKWTDINAIIRKPISFIHKIYIKLFKHNFEYNMVDICKLLNKVNNNYDIIISTCQPFSLHLIACKLLETYRNARWYPVFLDPYVYNYCSPKKKLEKRKKLACKTLKNAEKIFMVRGIKEENENKEYFPDYHNKVVEISIPNLIDLTNVNRNNNSKLISLTYAGMFYKDIRNPKKMFEILDKIGKGFEFNLMSKCCDDLVNSFVNESKNIKINNYGYLERKECLKVFDNSNILVNLGNTITNQTPSKVFEYIGMGKPIINFYFDEHDTSLFYLKKYPLCFNINVNNYTEKDVENLREFCIQNKNKTLTFDEATVNLKEEIAEIVCKKFYDEVNCD